MIRHRNADSVFRAKRIGFVAFDQVTASYLIEPASVFSRATLDDGYGGRIPCYELCTIGVSSERLQSECGLVFRAEEILNNVSLFDTIIIAGGKGNLNPTVSEPVSVWLNRMAVRTRRIGAIGTGIYALATTGLLHRRNITADWKFASDFAQRYPSTHLHPEEPIVQDGRYITASGPDGGTNLSLTLIRQDYGPNIARSVLDQLRSHQSPQTVQPPSRKLENQLLDRFGDLVGWVVRNLDRDLSLAALARKAGMSPGHLHKTFKRVFGVSPKVFVTNIRFNEARRLARKRYELSAIATSFGYDPKAFQRAYERRFGRSCDSQNDEEGRMAGAFIRPVVSVIHEGIASSTADRIE